MLQVLITVGEKLSDDEYRQLSKALNEELPVVVASALTWYPEGELSMDDVEIRWQRPGQYDHLHHDITVRITADSSPTREKMVPKAKPDIAAVIQAHLPKSLKVYIWVILVDDRYDNFHEFQT